MLGKLGSLPIAEKSATVGGSVFAVAVLPEGAAGLGELDLHEESSRWHLQGNLGGSDVEKAVVLFQLYVPVFAKQGIKIGETVLGLFHLKAVFNGQPKELKVVAKVSWAQSDRESASSL